MADEELRVRASMEDDLSRPMRSVKDETRDTSAHLRRMGSSDAPSAARGLGSVTAAAAGLAKGVGRALTGALKAGSIALGALVVGAVAAGAKMLALATDAGETASKFTTVFGSAAGQVSAYNQRMVDDFGMTTKAMQDATSTFAVFGKAAGIPQDKLAGFSTDLTQAGLDLSSFYNVASEGTEGTLAALRSGLAGEAEPLRKFGIFLSDATMKAKAAQMGLTGELTEGQKVAVRQKIILEQMGDAQGDLARTSGSLANQQRALKGRITEAATAMGQAFLPAGQKVVGFLSTQLAPITTKIAHDAPLAGQALVDAFNDPDVTSDGMVGVAERIGVALRRVVDLGKEVRAGWADGGGFDGAVAAMDRGVGAGGRLSDGVAKVVDVGRDLWKLLTDALVPALSDGYNTMKVIPSPLGLIADGIGLAADHASTLRPIVTALVAGFLAYKTAVTAVNAVQAIQNGLAFLSIARTSGLAAAQAAATGSTGALAAGTGVLNAVMMVNPVVLVVAAIAALAAGLVLAYQKVGWFHAAVDATWQAIQVAWDWITKVGGYLLTFNPMTGPFVLLLKNLPTVFDGIKTAAGFVVDVFKKVWQWVDKVAHALEKVGGPLGDALKVANKIPGLGRLVPGDTPRPHARGGHLGRTLGHHAALEAGTPGRRWVSSSVRHHALGSYGSDHARGAALDLVGSRLGSYRRAAQRAGHFAEFHGTGKGRHLHVAYGDTPRPRARPRGGPPPGAGAMLVIEAGAIVVNEPASTVDLEAGVARGIERWHTDREERS